MGVTSSVVPKKVKGDWRFVVDYWALDQVTEHDAYQLPLINDMLNRHGAKTVFTPLNINKRDHQMPLAPTS